MELHFEISDKFADLILKYFRREYEPEGRHMLLRDDAIEVGRLIGIIVSDAIMSSNKMKDEVEINCFGGWVKPTIQEITADSSLRLVKPLPRE